MPKEGVNPEKAIKLLPFFYLGFAIIFGLTAHLVNITIKLPENDLSNATALVIEAGIGIAITWTVYLYSKRMHEENKKQQIDLQKIIEEQEQFKKRRRNFSIQVIRSHLPELLHIIDEREKKKSTLTENILDDVFVDSISTNKKYLNYVIHNISFHVSHSLDVIEPHFVESLRQLIQLVGEYSEEDLGSDTKSRANGINGNIQALLNELPNPPI